MSHNDYTKYAREPKVETPEAPVEVKPEPVIEPAKPEVVDTPVAEVFVTGTTIEPVIEEPKPEMPEVEPEVKPEQPRKMGRVHGCTRLNVRKAPKPRAEVVCEIYANTEVEIDEDNSTVDFYKIFTASGIEGYCVKTYIDVAK